MFYPYYPYQLCIIEKGRHLLIKVGILVLVQFRNKMSLKHRDVLRHLLILEKVVMDIAETTTQSVKTPQADLTSKVE
jgi:hypothetical protein